MSEVVPTSSSGKSAPEVAVSAAKLAGEIIRSRFHTQKEVTSKGRANVVTDVDLLAEKGAISLFRQEYPAFGILAEESEPVATSSGCTWILDPLDGSKNYSSGIPHFAVALALTMGDEVLLGVTYDPMKDELFSAEKGKGAYLNGNPISVSSKQEISECLIGFDMGYSDKAAAEALELIRGLWPGMQTIRVMGSAALGLAYAACGRIDLYFHHHLSPWDLASGILLVSEAGGCVVNKDGDAATTKFQSAIASNPRLVDRFLKATEGMTWRE